MAKDNANVKAPEDTNSMVSEETATVAAETAAPEKEKSDSDYLNEMITINLFKDSGKYSDDVIVTLNGKNWQIQRGVDVEVPRKVKLILDEQQKQRGRAATIDEEAQSIFEEKKDQL